MSDSPQIIADFLDGKLSEQACRQALQADPSALASFETSLLLRQIANAPRYDAIPYIDTRTMYQAQWGHVNKTNDRWPKLAVACSILAMVVSLSPLQLQVQDGALALSWAGANQQQLNAQLDQRLTTMLASYKTEQQLYLQQQLQTQQQQQTTQLILLKDYLTESEQKNRRNDMLELVEYLNNQRQADWDYWQTQARPQQASVTYSPLNVPSRRPQGVN